MNIKRVIILFAFGLFLCFTTISCKQESSEPSPGFHKIYDNEKHLTYSGLDVKELENSGFIILGKVNESPYLLRVDRNGEFMWDTPREAVENFSNPVPELLVLDKNSPTQLYVIFCINQSTGEDLVLLKFTERDGVLESKEPEEIPLSISTSPNEGLKPIKPLHAIKLPGNGFLLTVSARFGRKILVIKAASDGKIDWVEEYIVSFGCFHDHPPSDERIYVSGISANEDKFFFQTYKISNNGDSSDGKCFKIVLGNINGTGLEDVLTSENPFMAMEWYCTESGERKFSGISVSLKSSNATLFINLPPDDDLMEENGKSMIDMNSTRKTFIQTIELEGESILFWGFDSNVNQIVLNAFDMDREFRGSGAYGSAMVYELKGLLKTSDTGLVILGDTTVLARMHRILLIKLSREELIAMKNQQ